VTQTAPKRQILTKGPQNEKYPPKIHTKAPKYTQKTQKYAQKAPKYLQKAPKYHKDTMETKLKEPLVLKQGELEYKLKFNCKPCEMEIWEKDAEFEIEEDHNH
jgi:hypothetical protein